MIWIAGSITSCNLFLPSAGSKSDPHLVAYFPFDKNANDLISPNRKATIVGATLVKGVKGNAYVFDGIDDFIEINNSRNAFNFKSTDSYSISFYVKPAHDQQDLTMHENDLLSKWVINDQDTTHLQTGYPFCIRYVNQKAGKHKGRIYLANWGGPSENCQSGNKIIYKNELSTDQFNHLVFTQNKDTLRLYLNGRLTQQIPNQSMCSTTNNANLRIGKRGGLKYQNHFAGVIDELRLYNVELSEVEILRLFEE